MSDLNFDSFFKIRLRVGKFKSVYNSLYALDASSGYFGLALAMLPRVGIFDLFIVSTGGIRWILWFSVRYAATTAARREIFGVNPLRGKLHQLDSPNLQDIFIGGKPLRD